MNNTSLKSLRLIWVATALAMPSVVLAATPTQQEVQKLLASDGGEFDLFGDSVAISGDTAVIGAYQDDDNGDQSGSAYVYTRDARGVWTEQDKLIASDGAAGDVFGGSVAVSGDTAVIGAAGGNSAYLYTRDASGIWTEQAKLIASDGDDFDSFGFPVSVSGDTAVIGAYTDDDNGDRSGSAYVYTRDASGIWTEQAKLIASDGAYQDIFGISLSVSGDTLVIGAPLDDDNGSESGSAYMYARDSNGVWSEQAKLIASDGEPGDNFGMAVSVGGATAVIGAPLDDDKAAFSGSAYVYTRDANGIWIEHAKLLARDGAVGDEFGNSVAVRAATAVIGANWRDDNGASSGAAYVYTRDASGVWSEQVKLLPSDGSEGEFFGQAVAMSGETVVIGTPYGDTSWNRIGPGSAYVYELGRGPDSGATLQCPGDINGDGMVELVVVTADGRVQVKDLAGAEINSFELAAIAGVVDSELMPDTNTNDAPELVAMTGSQAEVRDLLTGGHLGTVTFGADLAPLDLELVADLTGNGIPELAGLGRDPMRVDVRDGLTGALVKDVGFASYVTGRDLAIYPDLNGNGSPELSVLAEHRHSYRSDKIEIRDAASGETVREIWLGKDWRVLEQELISDLNGNRSREVAVLRVHPAGNVQVQIRDTMTGEWLKFIGFAVKYRPKHLVSIPDINGNGADELVLLGQRFDGSDQNAVIKDSKTGDKLGQLWFDRNFHSQDFVDCGDINGNGALDLALLGQRTSDSQLRVIVKDSKTSERLGVVQF